MLQKVVPDLHYTKAGYGDAIVLLHGFPSDGSLWHDVLLRLAERFTVIVPDLPGAGKSQLRVSATIPEMALGVKAVLDQEQIGKAVIAGHSMGGYVAFEFAKRFPISVAGLCLVHSTPLPDDEERKQIRHRAIDIIRNGGKEPFVRQMVPNLFSGTFKRNCSEKVEKQIQSSLLLEPQSLINFYEAMMLREDYSGVLIKAGFPVQWVMGMEDNVLNYKKIIPFTSISNINFVSLYPQCGHMSMLEAPENLVDDLSRFLKFSFCQ